MSKRTKTRILVAALLLAALTVFAESISSIAAGEHAYYSISFAPAYIIPSGESPERGSVSPDGNHLAVWMSVGSRGYVWFDGTRSRLWDAVLLPKFSPDSRHVAYIALEESGADSYRSYVVFDTTIYGPFSYLAFDKFGTDELVFSPDSLHFAFRAWEGGKAYVYIDGKKSNPYDSVISTPPQYSPDSRRLAYFIADSSSSRAIIDGHLGPGFPKVADLAGFSDDSRSFAYGAVDSDGKFRIIQDTTVSVPLASLGVAQFRPGTHELWYSASSDTTRPQTLFAGGKAKSSLGVYRELTFSDDNKRVGFIAQDGDQSVVVVDSIERKFPGVCAGLQFSPGGRHYSFVRSLMKDSLAGDTLFIDSHPFGPYGSISPVVFSPNGLSWLVSARDSLGKYYVLYDSARLGPFDSAAVVGWSPDSKQYAFTTMESGKARMYMNGRAEQPYRHVMRQVWFDTLGNAGVYVADPEAKGISLVVNDSSLAMIDFIYGSAPAFTDNGFLRGYAQRGDTIVQFTIRREK